MKQLNQKKQKKIKIEYVATFTIQAPPEFCFSKLSDEEIRRRAHKDVLTIQMEPEVGGSFIISCQKPTGTVTIQMKITEYSPPSALKITARSAEKKLVLYLPFQTRAIRDKNDRSNAIFQRQKLVKCHH